MTAKKNSANESEEMVFVDKKKFRRFSRDHKDFVESEQDLRYPQLQQQQQSAQEATKEGGKNKQAPTPTPVPLRYNITTEEDLEAYFSDTCRRFRKDPNKLDSEINYDALLNALCVQGDTQSLGSPTQHNLDYTHPVAQVLHDRQRRNSPLSTSHMRPDDGCRVALCIEGGGMRGCVSAGMICAIEHLGLRDTFDVVYGSSAGTIVGAYFITRQTRWFGPEVYYDCLTTAGREFIDTRRLLRAIGFGLLDPRLLKDVVTRPHSGKPVLNLRYLLQTTMQEKKPLDWQKFVDMQAIQPLKVVASGLKSEKAIVMDMAQGHFDSLQDMSDCMHASCLLPGIAGPLMNLDTTEPYQGYYNPTTGQTKHNTKKMVLGNNVKGFHYEPLADALVFEPLPYRSAMADGATHVLVIRSRGDGKDVTGKSSVFERLIFRRFLLRKNPLPRIFQYLKCHLHKKLYAQDILRLNKAAKSTRDPYDNCKIKTTNTGDGGSSVEQKPKEAHIMTIAIPPEAPEVTRLETGREAIFQGFRHGFARAYDCLVADPKLRGQGHEVAKQFFPDEILDYDPLTIQESPHDTGESAFTVYMRQENIRPKSWMEEMDVNGGKGDNTSSENNDDGSSSGSSALAEPPTMAENLDSVVVE
jgi:predicted patatin/cPLA2 family phospholipase